MVDSGDDDRGSTCSEMLQLAQLPGSEYYETTSSHAPNHRVGQLLEKTAFTTTENQPTSYYFPPDSEKPNWVAFTMTTPYLTVLLLISIGIAVGQEILYRRSLQTDGLLFYRTPQDIAIWQYFLWRYAPTILTVHYGIAVQATNAQVYRLEPFYRMAAPQGAWGCDSLAADPTHPCFVLSKPHSLQLMLSTLMLVIAVLVIPTIQNASISVKTLNNNQVKAVVVVSVWSRMLSATLLLNAAFLIGLWWAKRSGSGLLNDPRGIAGHLKLVTKSHILQDFKQLDLRTHAEILERLEHRRYVLYKNNLWQGMWSTNSPQAGNEDEQEPRSRHNGGPPPLLRFFPAIIFGFVQLTVLTMVPVLTFSKANSLLQKIPWILTAFGVFLKFAWSQIDASTRQMEPWYYLARGNQKPSILFVDYTPSTVYSLPFRAYNNGHWLMFSIGIVSVFMEVLVVCLSSFGLKGTAFLHRDPARAAGEPDAIIDDVETSTSFWWSFGLSITVLILLLAATIIVYIKRSSVFLPRSPGTISSILAYIQASNILFDFVDKERLTNDELLKILNEIGKTYRFGWFEGLDAKVHLGIAEEPLLAPFVWGKGFTHDLASDVSN